MQLVYHHGSLAQALLSRLWHCCPGCGIAVLAVALLPWLWHCCPGCGIAVLAVALLS